MRNIIKNKSGQSLVEIMIALSVFVIGVATIGFLLIDSSISSRQSKENIKANLLAREGIEAVRSIRDNNFGDLSNGTHGVQINQSRWELTNDPQSIDNYTRTIEISTPESEVRKVKSIVEWDFSESRSASTSMTTYLTKWQKESQGQGQGQGNN